MKHTKTVAHLGGWPLNSNAGDWAIYTGLQKSLREEYHSPINFVPIDAQNTFFSEDLVNYLNLNFDLLLVGAGGMIMNRPEDNSVSGWQFNIFQHDIEKIKIPIVVYGIGYNSFPHDTERIKDKVFDHVKALQMHSKLFSVRNQGTKHVLCEHGLREELIDVIPDPAMFAPKSKFTLPNGDTAKARIGLNWAGDREHKRFSTASAQYSLMEKVAKALDSLDARVYFIPHVKADYASGKWFREHMKKEIVDLSTAPIYPPNQFCTPMFVDVYSQMDYVVGMRGHSNIIAFGQNTPSMGIGEQLKVKFFLEEIKETDRLAKRANQVDPVLHAMLEDVDARKRLKKKFKQMKKTAKEFNEKVCKILDS